MNIYYEKFWVFFGQTYLDIKTKLTLRLKGILFILLCIRKDGHRYMLIILFLI